MLINQQANAIDSLLKLLSWLISIICFGVGFIQTGIGLRTFFAWPPFGFIISAFIFSALIFCYIAAVHKNRAWIFPFMIFAAINFVCNFNAFYPNQMVDTLIRNELKEHRQYYAALSEDIHATFLDTKLVDIKSDVEAKSQQLQKQILQDGLGDKSKTIIDQLNKLLGTQLTLLRTERGNRESWRETANAYKEIINAELKSRIEKNDYKSKDQLIIDAQSQKELVFPKIDKILANPEKIIFPVNQTVAELIDDITKHYQSYCITAHRLQSNKAIQCDEKYASENSEIGKFSHTFPSALKHLNEINTVIVIVICLLIDFVAPLLAYIYLKSHQRDDTFTRSVFRLPWQAKDSIERV
jgi:Skp family chaperone for outer membrane proteins